MLNPLPPRTFYSNVTRNATFSEPPAGTYWMVMVLSEFDSVNCEHELHLNGIGGTKPIVRQSF
jgi:hypothetical protein